MQALVAKGQDYSIFKYQVIALVAAGAEMRVFVIDVIRLLRKELKYV